MNSITNSLSDCVYSVTKASYFRGQDKLDAVFFEPLGANRLFLLCLDLQIVSGTCLAMALLFSPACSKDSRLEVSFSRFEIVLLICQTQAPIGIKCLRERTNLRNCVLFISHLISSLLLFFPCRMPFVFELHMPFVHLLGCRSQSRLSISLFLMTAFHCRVVSSSCHVFTRLWPVSSNASVGSISNLCLEACHFEANPRRLLLPRSWWLLLSTHAWAVSS
ncbi:unnamed protein product [Protopolystoma xenopodis]|uniref:Uncharacterized protein n=1 Tax=Protopolystoma xenopodis TaxID=117903 RepID=A0A3S5FG96_9PLAT|nr:unnamed protein product [Protopolystoma xenopodis]